MPSRLSPAAGSAVASALCTTTGWAAWTSSGVGSVGRVGRVGASITGVTGGAGGVGGKISPDDSVGLTDPIEDWSVEGCRHVDPVVQVQTHPWIPVSIVCVVLPAVISPQVQVQVQSHAVGRLDVAGAVTAGAGVVAGGAGVGAWGTDVVAIGAGLGD